MRINTDKYVVCRECSEAEHFNVKSDAEARKLARKYGWKGGKNSDDPICPKCIDEQREQKKGA